MLVVPSSSFLLAVLVLFLCEALHLSLLLASLPDNLNGLLFDSLVPPLRDSLHVQEPDGLLAGEVLCLPGHSLKADPEVTKSVSVSGVAEADVPQEVQLLFELRPVEVAHLLVLVGGEAVGAHPAVLLHPRVAHGRVTR